MKFAQFTKHCHFQISGNSGIVNFHDAVICTAGHHLDWDKLLIGNSGECQGIGLIIS